MIKRWLVPITGFTQELGTPNGFDRLWKRLRNYSSNSVSVVTPQRWRANFDSLASFIDRQSSPSPDIRIFAYSWGCGHGFLQLAKQLRKRGHKISQAVLCDPVYHSWLRPWRAMLCSPHIRIPDNVERVRWMRQHQNRPRGTDLVADSPDTVIDSPVILARNHEFMDDSPEFQAIAMEAAK